MSMEQALETFFEESREMLQQMEGLLMQLEDTPDDDESLNAIFRAAHTIKGSAGLFGLDLIVGFTHIVENLLDKLRAREIVLSTDMAASLLECRDHIEDLLEHARAPGSELASDKHARGEALRQRLHGFMGHKQVEQAAVPVQHESKLESSGGGAMPDDTWHISLRFGRDVLRNGMDPLSFIRFLETLGQVTALETLVDAMPNADEMDAESCYMGFEIRFKSIADKQAIEDVFEFVRDDCELHILPPHSKVEEYVRLIKELPEENHLIGEILVAVGALTQSELDAGLRSQRTQEEQPLGEILVEQKHAPQPVVEAALEKQKQVKEAKAQDARFIRVHADKLDALINLVGELVIAGASTDLLARRNNDSALQESASTVAGLVEDIRDSALKLRMVEIGETFSRFQRVVRDVSKELGKDIQLQISGGETELDKTVVEKIGDPLMHLVRNSMDHGIEATELRLQRGKPARGTVFLHAFHDSGSIVIEVGDDGGGLNKERILRKAVERGLVQEGQNLSDPEVFNLIFEPGFSTAEQVTNLSGRGVGMDVVKRNIQALRGTVEISSEEGKGATVRIRLPLTLAIIDGFLVGVGDSSFVIPLEMVRECVELSDEERSNSRDRSYVNLRGEVLPFVRLRDQFDIGGLSPRRENVVVVQYGSQRAGVVVDTLNGEFQTVIKPLGQVFRYLRGISGSTILGTGEVALILDVPALTQMASSREEKDFSKLSVRN